MRQRRSIRDVLSVERILNIVIIILIIGLITYSTSLPQNYTDETTTEANLGTAVTDTTASQNIEKLTYTSVDEAVVFNVTPWKFSRYTFYVPLFDYDTLTIKGTMEILSNAANITVSVVIGTSTNSTRVEVNAGELSSFSLKAPITDARSKTDNWIVQGRVSFSTPTYSDLVSVQSITGVATSSGNLCPLTLDVQSSDGNSLYENEYMDDLKVQPLIHIGRVGSNLSVPVISPMRAMNEIYVNPGNFSGTVYWSPHTALISPVLNVSLTLEANEAAVWEFRLPVLEITFTNTPNMPVYNIDVGNVSDFYELRGVLGGTPDLLYLPPVATTIYIEAAVPDIWRGDTGTAGPLPNVPTAVVLDGSHNIEVTVTTPYLVILDTGFSISELVIIAIGAVALLLIMIRFAMVFIPEYMTRNLKDMRMIAVIVVIITGFLPWFAATKTVTGAPQETTVLTYTFWSALSTTGVSAGNSIILPAVQDFYFYVGVSALAFFWIPLAFLITHAGTPRSWAEDGLFNAIMFPQAFLAGFSLFYTLFNVHNTVPLIGTYLAIGLPFAWIIMRQGWKMLRGKVPENHDTLKSIEHARDFVPNIVEELGNPENVKNRALEILKEIETETIFHDSYDPVGFAAGAVYMACLEYECEGINETKIVLASGVESMRLRPIFRVIGEELTKVKSENE
jgi:hypothetical protein